MALDVKKEVLWVESEAIEDKQRNSYHHALFFFERLNFY